MFLYIRALCTLGLLAVVTASLPIPPQKPAQQYHGPEINVRSFGAKGDGATDDTSAIRRAISAIPLSGGTIRLPCGTYLLSSGLTIGTSHTTIMSDEGSCATLKLEGRNGFVALSVRGKGLTESAALVKDTTDSTFTVGSGELQRLGIVAGSYAIISDKEVASNGPNSPPISTQQVVRIAAIVGDTATLDGEFAHHFTLETRYPENQGCCPYVQKILGPVEDVHVSHLNFDGSGNRGSQAGAMRLYYAVNSEVGFVSASNFTQAPGPTDAFLVDTGYGNRYHDIVCTACGNGNDGDGHSMAIRRQTNAAMDNISIRNTAAQEVFSFNLASVNYSTATKVLIDGGGSDGRPFKLLRANHNTFTEVTAKNGGDGKNGFNITDMSTYNTFRDCKATGNNGTGIMMFGNFNDHNVFVNCISESNTVSQFGQGKDASGHYADHFTTIKGGTFCCGRGDSNLIQINSDDFTMTDATVYDDQGHAPNALVIRGSRSVLKDNKITGFKFRHDVVYSKE